MSNSPESRQNRLDELLAEYFAQAEAGCATSRDELISQNPEFGDELREFFTDKQQENRRPIFGHRFTMLATVRYSAIVSAAAPSDWPDSAI